MFDLILKNGTVIDGTKAPRYQADVGILGDRIAQIGCLGEAAARQVIDATGKIVAPGFVDVHKVTDGFATSEGRASEFHRHGLHDYPIGSLNKKRVEDFHTLRFTHSHWRPYDKWQSLRGVSPGVVYMPIVIRKPTS